MTITMLLTQNVLKLYTCLYLDIAEVSAVTYILQVELGGSDSNNFRNI